MGQYKMIFHHASTSILLAITLATPVPSVRWIRKLNSDIFQLEVENERGEKNVEEGAACEHGFFCMFFGDENTDVNKKDDEKFNDKKISENLGSDSITSFEDLTNFRARQQNKPTSAMGMLENKEERHEEE